MFKFGIGDYAFILKGTIHKIVGIQFDAEVDKVPRYRLTGNDYWFAEWQLLAIPNPHDLPFVPILKRGLLPTTGGIYYVLFEPDSLIYQPRVIYIGQAANLRERWRAHHRYAQLEPFATGIRIAWYGYLSFDWAMAPQQGYINKLETCLINHCDTMLNWEPIVGETAED